MNTATRPHRIRCAHCTVPAEHATAREVEYCAGEQAEAQANAEAEMLAERRAERYFEEGPESFQVGRWAEEQEERERLGPDAIWV